MAYQQPFNPYSILNQAFQQPQGMGMAYMPQAPQAQPPMQQPQQGAQEAFICRPVTSREEAVATPVDYMRPILLPDLSHGRIYLKKFNTQTGGSDIFDFAFAEPEQAPAAPQYATVEELNALREELEKLKKPAGRGKKTDDE